MYRLRLEVDGYTVGIAPSGEQGLQQARDWSPDLIYLDIRLPGINGIEVLRRLRADPVTAGIPVVILSARAEPKDKIRGLQEGAIDYVTKPFAVRDILTRIAALLGQSPAQPGGPAAAPGPAGPAAAEGGE
ncbi:MAG: response regulator [Acidobacteria bacterium]|nr:response regulator [Acidobacteriota bacterium]